MKRFTAIMALGLLVLLAGCERSERISSPPPQGSSEAPPPTPATETAATSPQTTPPAIPPPPPPPEIPPLPGEQPPPAPASTDEVAVISTTKGDMVAHFWPDVAPKTVENFKKLAKEGFYDGTAFHRIMKGFMIQGGDPLTKDPAQKARFGTGDPGYKIDAEFNERKHERKVLSMARGPDPNSAGSQFFICLGPAPFLDRQYTAFGILIKGEEVLDAIGETPVGPNPNNPREVSDPLERVEIKSVKIVPLSQAM